MYELAVQRSEAPIIFSCRFRHGSNPSVNELPTFFTLCSYCLMDFRDISTFLTNLFNDFSSSVRLFRGFSMNFRRVSKLCRSLLDDIPTHFDLAPMFTNDFPTLFNCTQSLIDDFPTTLIAFNRILMVFRHFELVLTLFNEFPTIRKLSRREPVRAEVPATQNLPFYKICICKVLLVQ